MFASFFRRFSFCRHSKVTFPQGPACRMHVTCVECGRVFEYDWRVMKRGRAIAPPAGMR
jgi:Fe2+ or Zn2+ uptake regulation protein